MTNVQTGRKIVLFGQPYQWERRATDGGKKAPKRKKGQLLLRRVRSKTFEPVGPAQPHLMAAVAPPCAARLQTPVPGMETGTIEKES